MNMDCLFTSNNLHNLITTLQISCFRLWQGRHFEHRMVNGAYYSSHRINGRWGKMKYCHYMYHPMTGAHVKLFFTNLHCDSMLFFVFVPFNYMSHLHRYFQTTAWYIHPSNPLPTHSLSQYKATYDFSFAHRADVADCGVWGCSRYTA
jgi:hypothetical protein